jgi:hypothetical protein
MMTLLHGGFMAGALLWLTARHRQWALPRLWPHFRVGAAP